MTRTIIATMATLFALHSLPALAQQPLKVGVLNCDVSGGVGLIVASKKDMICVFEGAGGRVERYAGTIRKFGLDIGATQAGTIVWAVFAVSAERPAGALAGDYVGASGEATAGVGLGANVLVGGLGRSVSLQPVSLSGPTGLNIAVGVADLPLRPDR